MHVDYFKHESESRFHTIFEARDDCRFRVENATSHDLEQVSKAINSETLQTSGQPPQLENIEHGE